MFTRASDFVLGSVAADTRELLALTMRAAHIVHRRTLESTIVWSRMRFLPREVTEEEEEAPHGVRIREERMTSSRYGVRAMLDQPVTMEDLSATVRRVQFQVAASLYVTTHQWSVPEVFNLNATFDGEAISVTYEAFPTIAISPECSLASDRLALTPVQRLQVAAVHRGYNVYESPSPWGNSYELFRVQWVPLAGETRLERLEEHARHLTTALDTLETLVPSVPERRATCTVRYTRDGAFVFERHDPLALSERRFTIGGHPFPMETHSNELDEVAFTVAEIRREYEERVARYPAPPPPPPVDAHPPPTPSALVADALVALSIDETPSAQRADD